MPGFARKAAEKSRSGGAKRVLKQSLRCEEKRVQPCSDLGSSIGDMILKAFHET